MCEDLNIGYFSIDLNKHSNCEFTLNINRRENSISEICLTYVYLVLLLHKITYGSQNIC